MTPFESLNLGQTASRGTPHNPSDSSQTESALGESYVVDMHSRTGFSGSPVSGPFHIVDTPDVLFC
jgi:hypothetical protein